MAVRKIFKRVVVYTVGLVGWGSIAVWLYSIQCYFPLAMIIVLIFAFFVGCIYSLATQKKHEFVETVDNMSSMEFYRAYVEKQLSNGEYKVKKIADYGDFVYSECENMCGDRRDYVTIIKKDYVYDSDILVEGEGEIALFTNSYYKGNRNVCEVFNRKDVLRLYKKKREL